CFAAPATVFEAKDGSLFMGALLDSHWKILATVMGRPDLADDTSGYTTIPGRLGARDAVNALVSEWAATRTVAEIMEPLHAAGLPAAPVRTYAEAASDPH